MFLSSNKKNNVYPCKPQFYYIKVGFKGSKLYRHVFCFRDVFISLVPTNHKVSSYRNVSSRKRFLLFSLLLLVSYQMSGLWPSLSYTMVRAHV